MGDWVLVKKPFSYKSNYTFKCCQVQFVVLYIVTELSQLVAIKLNIFGNLSCCRFKFRFLGTLWP